MASAPRSLVNSSPSYEIWKLYLYLQLISLHHIVTLLTGRILQGRSFSVRMNFLAARQLTLVALHAYYQHGFLLLSFLCRLTSCSLCCFPPLPTLCSLCCFPAASSICACLFFICTCLFFICVCLFFICAFLFFLICACLFFISASSSVPATSSSVSDSSSSVPASFSSVSASSSSVPATTHCMRRRHRRRYFSPPHSSDEDTDTCSTLRPFPRLRAVDFRLFDNFIC